MPTTVGDISSMTLPNNEEYNIKDGQAREDLANDPNKILGVQVDPTHTYNYIIDFNSGGGGITPSGEKSEIYIENGRPYHFVNCTIFFNGPNSFWDNPQFENCTIEVLIDDASTIHSGKFKNCTFKIPKDIRVLGGGMMFDYATPVEANLELGDYVRYGYRFELNYDPASSTEFPVLIAEDGGFEPAVED